MGTLKWKEVSARRNARGWLAKASGLPPLLGNAALEPTLGRGKLQETNHRKGQWLMTDQNSPPRFGRLLSQAFWTRSLGASRQGQCGPRHPLTHGSPAFLWASAPAGRQPWASHSYPVGLPIAAAPSAPPRPVPTPWALLCPLVWSYFIPASHYPLGLAAGRLVQFCGEGVSTAFCSSPKTAAGQGTHSGPLGEYLCGKPFRSH